MNHSYDNNIAVIGLGKTGLSLVKWLLNKKKLGQTLPNNNNSTTIFAYDVNLQNIEKLLHTPEYAEYIRIGKLIIGLLPQSIDECIEELQKNQIIIIYSSPGIPMQPSKTNQMLAAAQVLEIKICSDIDLFFDHAPKARYIGITGTNGKSTTTALVGWIFQQLIDENRKKIEELGPDIPQKLYDKENYRIASVFVGGNIGTPILDLPCHNSKDTIYVIELSSYQLDLIHYLQLEIALCLNVTPDHLDRYGNMENYAKSKQNIFAMLKDDGLAVIGSECSYLVKKKNEKMTFGDIKISALELNKTQALSVISGKQILNSGISVYGGGLWIDGIRQSDLLDVNKINKKLSQNSLVGAHNAENIAAAAAICMNFGIERKKIINGCKTFKGLPHRMEYITTYRGYRIINDSKATNIESTKYALDSSENIYWIAGGISKDEGIIALQSFFHKINCTYLIGQCQNEFAEVLERFGVRYQICHELNTAMEKIVDEIDKTLGKKNGTILLSPACASTDQWLNFEERGKAFCDFFMKR